jgi:ABC-type cobalt transport system substrate-binding protein
MEPGTRVTITLPAKSPFLKCIWFPKSGEVTGTVQKCFKNGLVAVAVDQIGNASTDGRRTLHFSRDHLSIRLHGHQEERR